jgi:putative DNA primase/helicase
VVTASENDVSTPDDLFVGYTNWASREGQAEFKKVTLLKRFPDYARKSWAGLDDKMRSFWKTKNSTTFYKGIYVRPEFLQANNAAQQPDYPPEGAPF